MTNHPLTNLKTTCCDTGIRSKDQLKQVKNKKHNNWASETQCDPGLIHRYRRETPLMGDPSFFVFMHGPLLDGRVMIPWSRIDETKCWHCPVATTFYTAKLAGIVILQGHAQLPRNNPQNFNKIGCASAETKRVWFCSRLARFLTLRIKFGLSLQDGLFRSSLAGVSLAALTWIAP